ARGLHHAPNSIRGPLAVSLKVRFCHLMAASLCCGSCLRYPRMRCEPTRGPRRGKSSPCFRLPFAAKSHRTFRSYGVQEFLQCGRTTLTFAKPKPNIINTYGWLFRDL